MNLSDESSRLRVEWTRDQRRCTATAVDADGQPVLVVTFQSAVAIDDPIARHRMEEEAVAALRRLLAP